MCQVQRSIHFFGSGFGYKSSIWPLYVSCQPYPVGFNFGRYVSDESLPCSDRAYRQIEIYCIPAHLFHFNHNSGKRLSRRAPCQGNFLGKRTNNIIHFFNVMIQLAQAASIRSRCGCIRNIRYTCCLGCDHGDEQNALYRDPPLSIFRECRMRFAVAMRAEPLGCRLISTSRQRLIFTGQGPGKMQRREG